MDRSLPTLCTLLVIAWSACHAQIVPGDTTAVRDSTVAGQRILAADTLHLPAPPYKSTGTAMLFSAILPGAGQVYNESYWKAPLVLGLSMYFISEFMRYNRYADDYRQLYLASLSTVAIPAYQTKREDYKNLRDANVWYRRCVRGCEPVRFRCESYPFIARAAGECRTFVACCVVTFHSMFSPQLESQC